MSAFVVITDRFEKADADFKTSELVDGTIRFERTWSHILPTSLLRQRYTKLLPEYHLILATEIESVGLSLHEILNGCDTIDTANLQFQQCLKCLVDGGFPKKILEEMFGPYIKDIRISADIPVGHGLLMHELGHMVGTKEFSSMRALNVREVTTPRPDQGGYFPSANEES